MSQRASNRLWKDFDGEPFLINPHLIVANPQSRKGSTMARRKRARSYRRARKNWMNPGVVNPRRRRFTRRRRTLHNARPARRRRTRTRHYSRAMSNPRRRSFSRRRFRRARSNPPSFMGLQLPPLGTALAVAGGFALPAILEGYILPYLPDVLTGNTAGRWAVRVGIVAGAGMLAKKFVNPRVGNAILIGGGAWLVIQALKEFAPGLIPGVGAQPLLGYYNSMDGLSGYADATGNGMALYNVPDRLNAAMRY